MPSFEAPAAVADEVQTALRALAHATRSIDDPRQIYSVLGSLTSAVASLSQSLHQIAGFHDRPPQTGEWKPVTGSRTYTGYQVAWDLHRAGEILRQVSTTIDHAHSAESQITYERRAPDPLPHSAHRSTGNGLGL